MQVSPINNVYRKDISINQQNKTINLNKSHTTFQGNNRKALDTAGAAALMGVSMLILAAKEPITLEMLMGAGGAFGAIGAIVGKNFDKMKNFYNKEMNEFDKANNK